MSINVNETLVRDFYQLYHARNREAFEALMHPDFQFSSPWDDHIDKAAYFARCWDGGDRMSDFTVKQVAAVNQFVFLNYTICITETGEVLENTERFTIEEDKVRNVRVFIGTESQDARTRIGAA